MTYQVCEACDVISFKTTFLVFLNSQNRKVNLKLEKQTKKPGSNKENGKTKANMTVIIIIKSISLITFLSDINHNFCNQPTVSFQKQYKKVADKLSAQPRCPSLQKMNQVKNNKKFNKLFVDFNKGEIFSKFSFLWQEVQRGRELFFFLIHFSKSTCNFSIHSINTDHS